MSDGNPPKKIGTIVGVGRPHSRAMLMMLLSAAVSNHVDPSEPLRRGKDDLKTPKPKHVRQNQAPRSMRKFKGTR
jgi:hypothetical protein